MLQGKGTTTLHTVPLHLAAGEVAVHFRDLQSSDNFLEEHWLSTIHSHIVNSSKRCAQVIEEALICLLVTHKTYTIVTTRLVVHAFLECLAVKVQIHGISPA